MSEKTIRFFLTGGAGFIGSHLADRLIKIGNVTVYDNLSSGRKEFIEHHLKSARFEFVKGDLLDSSKLKKAIKDHDIVFHLSANPDISYGIDHTDWDLKQETIATYNVLESMRQNGIKKIAFSSTSAVFGQPDKIPTSEDYGPLFPHSLYGANKLACEGLISAYVETFGFQAWIFRFANIIGERGTHGVLVDFINQLKQHPQEIEMLSDGTPNKNYLLVQECVEAMIFIFENANESINLFNLASLGQTTVDEIAKIVIKEMNLKDVQINKGREKRGWPGDVTNMMLDTGKLSKLGWQSKYNSTEAIKRATREVL